MSGQRGITRIQDADDVSGVLASGKAYVWNGTSFALTDIATQAELDTHAALTTTAHGGIVASSDARLTDTRTPTDLSVTDAKVSASAAIAESKLSLASDAAAGTASRRTLGTSATSAAAGNHNHDTRYAPQVSGLVLPVGCLFPHIDGIGSAPGANLARGMRLIVPKAGTLNNLYTYVGTRSANAIAAIFDVGEASAGNYTRLWTATVAMSGAASDNNWLKLGDPGLTVTQGQHLIACVAPSDGTATFARALSNGPAATAAQLPAAALPDAGNNSGKIAVQVTFAAGSVASSYSEVNMGLNAAAIKYLFFAVVS